MLHEFRTTRAKAQENSFWEAIRYATMASVALLIAVGLKDRPTTIILFIGAMFAALLLVSGVDCDQESQEKTQRFALQGIRWSVILSFFAAIIAVVVFFSQGGIA